MLVFHDLMYNRLDFVIPARDGWGFLFAHKKNTASYHNWR